MAAVRNPGVLGLAFKSEKKGLSSVFGVRRSSPVGCSTWTE
jgi:hypothetical protein